jgi:hypothetical protein
MNDLTNERDKLSDKRTIIMKIKLFIEKMIIQLLKRIIKLRIK